jgi:hypothetical protein
MVSSYKELRDNFLTQVATSCLVTDYSTPVFAICKASNTYVELSNRCVYPPLHDVPGTR